MADSTSPSLRRCTSLEAAKKGKKRRGSKLAAEASKVSAAAAEEVDAVDGAEVEKKVMWIMSQEEIDYILSWDVSDYVFRTPDNMDHMPISDATKQMYRANRQKAVAVMRENRRVKREYQEWVKSELEKHGYVEVEGTNELLAEHLRERAMHEQRCCISSLAGGNKIVGRTGAPME